MAVIINDFEIQVESPAESDEGSQPGADESAARQPGGPALSPMDLEDVQRRHYERQMRLWAH